ncbi:TraB/GumN family protein [Vibrio fluvialis]|uniref:TraB/GumN family protein n=1 Tax=Vibrio fluvialis TaxID=676 RepID=UPI0028F6E432|nr:TraB/GumN family protein [Vibrio fluvialis]
MHRITRGIIGLIWLFASALHAEPLYWQATNGSLQITLLGAIHVGAPSMYPLPKPIYKALNQADGLIIEADVRKDQNVVYPQNQPSSKQVLTKEQLFMLDKIAKQLELEPLGLRQAPPWQSALSIQFRQLQQLGFNPGEGVDLTLMYKATANNIAVIPLETVQFQIDALTRQPDAGKEMLTEIIDDWEKSEAMTRCMIDSWVAGDQQNLENMMKLNEYSNELEQTLVTNRNRDWVNKLTSGQFLPNPNGRYLMVVGALHLVGHDNLLELLSQKGFTITRLNQAKKAGCQFY